MSAVTDKKRVRQRADYSTQDIKVEELWAAANATAAAQTPVSAQGETKASVFPQLTTLALGLQESPQP